VVSGRKKRVARSHLRPSLFNGNLYWGACSHDLMPADDLARAAAVRSDWPTRELPFATGGSTSPSSVGLPAAPVGDGSRETMLRGCRHSWPGLVQARESSASSQLGNWNFVYAILVITLSTGIWRRRSWAWWCGFLLLGLAVCWSLFAMSARADVGPPVGIKVIFAIISCVIVGIWGRWWYAQRKHFLWTKEGR
jgi:hypothetical protein